MGEKTKILIVAGCFAPASAVGAKRPTGVALELQRLGHKPVVLTLARNCFTNTDPSRDSAELKELDIVRTRCFSVWNHSRKWRFEDSPIKRYPLMLANAFSKITKNCMGIDKLESWAVYGTKIGSRVAIQRKVDIIWATVPELSSALLAMRIHKATKLPFVVDYRDLMKPMTGRSRRSWVRKQKVEHEILDACAGITCVAPRQLESLAERFPSIANKPKRLIYNFFDPVETACVGSETSNQVLKNSIIYGGALYGGQRKIDGVIRALASGSAKNILRLDFYGRPADQEHVRNLTNKADATQFVFMHDSVEQSDFEKLCRESAIQLLIVGHGAMHEDTIPAKLFDYFRAARPLLVVGPKDCFAGQLAEQTNRGISVADDDIPGIANAIEKLQGSLDRNGKPLDFSPTAVDRFTRARCVAELEDFITHLKRQEN